MKHEIVTSRFEIKALSDSNGVASFNGYASVFNYMDDQMDIILPGAFAASLQNYKNVKMLWNHNQDILIGNYPSLKEDEKGLYVDGAICLDVPEGKSAYSLMKQGALDGLSIGYRVTDAEFMESGVRVIKSLNLFEISPVSFPANDKAVITDVKSIIERNELKAMTITNFERELREVFNCSQAEAKLIAAKGFNAYLKDREGNSAAKTPATDPWTQFLLDAGQQTIN